MENQEYEQTVVEQNEPENKTASGLLNKLLSKKVLPAMIAGVAVIITGIILIIIFNSPAFIYKRAENYLEKNKYDQAISCYEKLEDYKDSQDKCKQAYLGAGKEAIASGEYQKALELLQKASGEELNDYIQYANALIALNNGELDTAISGLMSLGDFEEAKSFLNEANYQKAEKLYAEKKYADAKTYYLKTEGFEDVAKKLQNCNLMVAEGKYRDGDLKEAKKLFLELPKDLEFEGIKVSVRLATLEKNAKIVDMCGIWNGKDGKLSVRQTHKSTGLWDQWDGEYTNTLELKCIINDDGTFTIKGTANYWVYTNYSSLSHLLKTSNRSKSFSVKGTTIPQNIVNDSSIKITYDGSKFHLNYDFTNNNYSMNFDYRYKSSVTYSK